MRHGVAFYEIGLGYGGPEEGRWYYPTGELVRIAMLCRTEALASLAAQRANRLLDRLQRRRRSVESVLYDGGRYRACVFEHTAPPTFPSTRPHYE